MLKLLTSLELALLTLRVNEYVVGTTVAFGLGVTYPEITPVLDMVNPLGNAPAITDTVFSAKTFGLNNLQSSLQLEIHQNRYQCCHWEWSKPQWSVR